MVRLAGMFSKLMPKKILTVGDLMLDKYTKGSVSRVSPEAPVVILKTESEEYKPGGAGNVVLNLKALGADVALLGRVGKDFAGKELEKLLSSSEVDLFLQTQEGYLTPLKNRLIAGGQQLLRIDSEDNTLLPAFLEKKIIEEIPQLVSLVDAVAISDYKKGFLSTSIIQALIKAAEEREIPLVVDPKGVDFSKYYGAFAIKPNLKEAYEAAKLSREEPLEKVAEVLLKETACKFLFITRSEDGVSLFDEKGKRQDFPTFPKEVIDSTGAGDTFLATLTFALANGMGAALSAEVGNLAAGIAVEQLGCVGVTLSQLAQSLLKYDIGSKIFEEDHLLVLKEALKDVKVSVLALADEFTGAVFKMIEEIKSSGGRLLVYLEAGREDEIDLLVALPSVDFVILKKAGLKNFLENIPADAVYLLKDGKLSTVKDPKMLFKPLLIATSRV